MNYVHEHPVANDDAKRRLITILIPAPKQPNTE
jgi:hypothetical protein